MNFTAVSAPTSRGTSCVPPQAGTMPRKHSGQAKWRTADEIVRASQWSASSTPPPRHAPLIAATVGNGSALIRPKSSCPARLPSSASSRVAPGNSVMSAPAAKTNGLPVITRPSQSPFSSSGSSRSSDSSAARPKKVGLVWSSPLSIVTRASEPARASLNSVAASEVLPDERGAHPHADAQCGEAVMGLGPLPEAEHQLREEAHSGRSERMAAGDRSAVWVEPLVLRIDSELLAPGEHLHREGLVQLDQPDVVERQARERERLACRRRGPDPHAPRPPPGKGIGEEPHPRLHPELLRRLLGREQAYGGAVGEARRVPGRHAAAGAKRRRQFRKPFKARVRTEELVTIRKAPALLREHRHRHDGLAHDAVLPGRRGPLLRTDCEGVRIVLRELRETVVQVLGRRAHRHSGGIDEPLGHEAGVEVDVLAHRVVPHVLDAACEDDVGGAHRDLACAGGDGRERSGAHAVDREPGHRLRQPCEQRDIAAERQALVSDLRGGGHDHVVDPLGRQLRAASEQLADDLHAEVVGARLPEDALRPGTPECGPHAVHVNDLAQLPAHAESLVVHSPPMPDQNWEAHFSREEARYRDGEARLPQAEDADSRQRQLTRLGNAAGGAGLSLLMQGRADEAAEGLHRAAERYRESFSDAPPGSWGRPIGVVKALVLAGDWDAATEAARWALDAGAVKAESPVGRYAAALALLVLGRRAEAREHADAIRTSDDFPQDVGDALAFLAAQDVAGYTVAVESVLESFETRDEYLEDIAAADTVLVLQALAARDGMAAELSSPLLPPTGSEDGAAQ